MHDLIVVELVAVAVLVAVLRALEGVWPWSE